MVRLYNPPTPHAGPKSVMKSGNRRRRWGGGGGSKSNNNSSSSNKAIINNNNDGDNNSKSTSATSTVAGLSKEDDNTTHHTTSTHQQTSKAAAATKENSNDASDSSGTDGVNAAAAATTKRVITDAEATAAATSKKKKKARFDDHDELTSTKKALKQQENIDTAAATATTAESTTVKDDDTTAISGVSRHAFAVDTRVLETSNSSQILIGSKVCHLYEEFIRTSIARGPQPCFLVTTVPIMKKKSSSTKKKKGNSSSGQQATGVGIHTIDFMKSKRNSGSGNAEQKLAGTKMFVEKTPIQAVVAAETAAAGVGGGSGSGSGTLSGGAGVTIPKYLSAQYGWKCLTHLVSTILVKDSEKRAAEGRTENDPLDITVLTSELALFCDTNVETHATSAGQFWDRFAPAFTDGKIGCIRIVVMTTGQLVSLQQQHEFSLEDNNAIGDDDRSDDDSMDVDNDGTAMKRNHEVAVARTIHAIQRKLTEKGMEVSCQLDEEGLVSVKNISFTAIEGDRVGFHSLSRELVRGSLYTNGLSRNLSFDLPSTADGTQCKVSFDLGYPSFPFPVNNTDATRLLLDLHYLSKSAVEVLQLVPLSSLDASLLFGSPIVATVALSENFDQYQEMEAITSSLFRRLQEQEAALYLRTCCQDTDDSMPGLFHASEQTFILMAQELEDSKREWAPNSGVLHRYAQAHQMLAESSSGKVSVSVDPEMASQYAEYVADSLDTLECGKINPLYIGVAGPPLAFPRMLATPVTSRRSMSIMAVSSDTPTSASVIESGVVTLPQVAVQASNPDGENVGATHDVNEEQKSPAFDYGGYE